MPIEKFSYLDQVYETDLVFKNEDEANAYFESIELVNLCKEKFGLKLPFYFKCRLHDEDIYINYMPSKQGIVMDWPYFSEQLPITEEVINNEENIEKRRLLIMEYGITNYLRDIKIISEDKYGVLISAVISGEDEVQKFVKVRNGTPEPEEKRAYLRERGMLTDDGHKIYYIPVPEHIQTAKEGIEDSWNLPAGLLPTSGWDYET